MLPPRLAKGSSAELVSRSPPPTARGVGRDRCGSWADTNPRRTDPGARPQYSPTARSNVLNEIQHVCGSDAAPFEATDISYIAYVGKDDRLTGVITIQKRTKETLEDDIATGAILAFSSATASQATPHNALGGVRSAANTDRQDAKSLRLQQPIWASLSRSKLTIGTQRAGRRTWIIRDPKEGTI